MGTLAPGADAESEPGRFRTAHPDERLLERFLRGDSTRQENQRIVRHFLSGCPRCREKMLPLWIHLADAAFRGEDRQEGPRRPRADPGTSRGEARRSLA